MEVWITSLTDESQIDRVCILATSLRRVATSKKLVVQVASKISERGRERLTPLFDLVLLLQLGEEDNAQSSETTFDDRESWAKANVFTLKIFRKCVYLSPSAIVVNNCDDIFDRYKTLAVGYDTAREKVDTSIFLATPHSKYDSFAKNFFSEAVNGGGSFSNKFEEWWHSESCGKWEVIDGIYNVIPQQQLENADVDTRIVNFLETPYPLDADWQDGIGTWNARFAANLCRAIHNDTNKSIFMTTPNDGGQEYEPLAIIGLSFRLPGANTPNEFWNLLVTGSEAIQRVPEHRWLPQHTSTHNVDRSIEAGFLDCRMDEVDSPFFGWSTADLDYIDPQQRLLHEVVWESLEDAGMDPHSLRNTSTGIFYGAWLQDYRAMCSKLPDRNMLREYLGSSLASPSARLSHFLGTTGPSLGFDEGCSSAFNGLHSACSSLRQRESSVAIVCGANLLLEPYDYSTIEAILSKIPRCKTFDALADGYCRAEGVVALVLKRLSDAVRDDNRIWGLVRGTAVVQDGVSKSLVTPSVQVESLAMKQALLNAGVHPGDVSVIEAHGSGTFVGDPIEVAAIRQVYSSPERLEPLLIGSVKTNVGHTEAVSGLVGVIKILLAMKEETVPPHRNLSVLHPNIDLDSIPARIPTSPLPWPRSRSGKMIAGVSSFGITGSNVHAIIEEPPKMLEKLLLSPTTSEDRPLHLMRLSATSATALNELLEMYESLLEKPEVIFADVAYSANTGRATFEHKAVVIAEDRNDALEVLRSKSFLCGETHQTFNPLCFVFTGQWMDQCRETSLELYATSPVFHASFDRCATLLQEKHGISLKNVLWENSRDQISNPALQSPAVTFCLEYCLLHMWLSWGVKPDYVLGHGLGEFGAAVAASALTFEEALQILVLWSTSPSNLNEVISTAFQTFHRHQASRMRLAKEEHNSPQYISGLLGKIVDLETLRSADYWIGTVKASVDFGKACQFAELEGCTLFLELGAHPKLTTPANLGGAVTCFVSLRRNENCWTSLLESLSKLYLSSWKGHIDWKRFDAFYPRKRVDLPKYPFQRKKAWQNPIIEPRRIHPLLGYPFPTPAAEGRVMFQNEVTLKKAPFIRDHVIGNSVIFPGAAFLDMCLAAGLSSTSENSKKPVGIKDLTISAPLKLFPSKFITFQTVLRLRESSNPDNETDGISVSIWSRSDPSESRISGIWTPHVKATFLPNILKNQAPPFPQLDIDEVIRSWSNQKSTLNKFYTEIAKLGLNFGPKFISLGNSWRKGQMLVFKLADNLSASDNGCSYLIHPLEVDAMMQALVFHTGQFTDSTFWETLRIPARIGCFQWQAVQNTQNFSTTPGKKKYICTWTDENDKKVHATLVDDLGSTLAYIGSVDFLPTTVERLEDQVSATSIQSCSSGMPSLWKEVWKVVEIETGRIDDGNFFEEGLDNNNLNSMVEYSWLILGDEAEPDLGLSLATKLRRRNRRVVFCPRPDVDKLDEHQLRSHIYKWLSRAQWEGVTLEGVLFLWPLSNEVIQSGKQELITFAALTLVQTVSLLKVTSKLVFVTRGACDINSYISTPSAAPMVTLFRTVRNEMPDFPLAHFDLGASTSVSEVEQIFSALGRSECDQIAFREGNAYIPKFISEQWHSKELCLPSGSAEFQLRLPPSKMISDLEFTHLQRNSIAEDEVEVAVKSIALNFRDLFTVIKPNAYFENSTTFGLDIAGVVSKVGSQVTRWSVGDRVIGLNRNPNQAMPSHTTFKPSLLVTIPPTWTMWEGCTLPTVFATSYLCLVQLGKVVKGETVLIHAASGGVGLCAIQLCRELGANVIVTAGSERKQNYLRSLGIQHVFNSRDTKFSNKILDVTQGRGVDLVLNSLTGPGFKEASLVTLTKGRFIEMSKLNIWTPEEVAHLRPDVVYNTVDISQLSLEELACILTELESFISRGKLRPLPFEKFDALNIRDALEYLGQACHIGKVVCVLPEVGIKSFKFSTPLFTPESTYLVTGGLGGIGFEVVKWILENGGRHVAIVSRNADSPPAEILESIEYLSKVGKVVRTFGLDVGNSHQVSELITRLSEVGLPPLRGVFHCAGILSDGTLAKQNWTKFEKTFKSKVDGTWILHNATKHLRLEYFVTFSSITALFGLAGQANYGCANRFQDALIAHRYFQGLPGTTINWGPWGEVGMAKDIDMPGLKPISVAEGLLTLENILRIRIRQIAVVNLASARELQGVASFLADYLDTKIDDSEFVQEDTSTTTVSGKRRTLMSSSQFWEKLEKTADDEEKLSVVLKLIESSMAEVLRVDDDDEKGFFNPQLNFEEQGIDSLAMLELRNHLQKRLGAGKGELADSLLKTSNSPYFLGCSLLQTLKL